MYNVYANYPISLAGIEPGHAPHLLEAKDSQPL